MRKPPDPGNKKGRACDAAEEELTNTANVFFRSASVKTEPDPAVARFNSALAAFFLELRRELRGER